MLMSMSSHSYSSYTNDQNDDIDVCPENFETLTHTRKHTHIYTLYTQMHITVSFNLAGVLLCWCLAPLVEVCLEINLHIHITKTDTHTHSHAHAHTPIHTYIQAQSCGVSLCPAAVNSVFKRYSYISMLYIVHPVYIHRVYNIPGYLSC